MLKIRLAAALVIITLVVNGCTIAGLTITPTKAVNLATAVELSLRDLQDATRTLCRPEIQRPNPIIGECSAASISVGFTTVKFRAASAMLAKAFDFMKDVLGPALDRWQPGEPPPPAMNTFALITKDVFDFLGTLVQTPQTQALFTTASTLASAIAALTKKIGADPIPAVTAFLEAQ